MDSVVGLLNQCKLRIAFMLYKLNSLTVTAYSGSQLQLPVSIQKALSPKNIFHRGTSSHLNEFVSAMRI